MQNIKEFICPITNEIMNDPVIDNDGNSYEKNAILEWLKRSKTSPITRKNLYEHNLSPNRALKNMIEKFKIDNPNYDLRMSTNNITNNINNDDVKLNYRLDGNNLFTSINIPDSDCSLDTDIVIIIDTSYSMGEEATIKNDKGETESHGLSLLDLVKHAAKTIIHSMNSGNIAIVKFSYDSETILPLTKMDNIGKKIAIECLEKLNPDGNTNLWSGLEKGLNIMKNNPNVNRNKSIILLTDGVPNVEPPRGHIAMLNRYIERNGQNCSIHTFGFGYSLDYALLNFISNKGQGTYSFIPDCGMVGTVFEHYFANIMTTMGCNAKIIHKRNDIPISKNDIGYISFGQKKTNLIRNFDPHTDTIHLEYFDFRNGKTVIVNPIIDQSINIIDIRFRLKFINVVMDALTTNSTSLYSANEKISFLQKELAPIKGTSKYLTDLSEDLNGQVTEAFSREDWFIRWGRFYLYSLINAHRGEYCNNFKDPGVQNYGGKLFKEILDYADDIFCSIEAPKPSIVKRSYDRCTAPPTLPLSMRSYSQVSSGCIDGNCIVKMADGSSKLVKNIRKGDRIYSSKYKYSTILCVIKTNICKPAPLIVFEDGLRITPYHPVKMNKTWKYPIDTKYREVLSNNNIYTFVLDREHIIEINNIKCITLGHNYTDEVVRHKYFGSKRVINDLQLMNGWIDGFIELQQYNALREKITVNGTVIDGDIVKLIQ